MDPNSFLDDFDPMQMDEHALFEGSSFLSDFGDDRPSAFTEAFMQPSVSQMRTSNNQRDFFEERELSSGRRPSNSNLGSYNHSNPPTPQPLAQVKQEPGVMSFVANLFSDSYVPSFVSPQAVTPYPISNHHNHNQQYQQQAQHNAPTFQTKAYHETEQKYHVPSCAVSRVPTPSSSHATPYRNIESPSGPHMGSEIDIMIQEQPPVEVRTRTPGENRTFTVKIMVCGNYRPAEITAISVKLLYANSDSQPPKQTILGGKKAVPIAEDGNVVFDSLCMTEASTKHSEKEFCLEFYYIQSNGTETSSKRTCSPFYAYSHKKVLTRRKNISLRALSQSYGSVCGGGEYHIVGSPFIKGPALKCVISTPHGKVCSYACLIACN
uniref:Uncharacterized protein n=1 Tax=Vannella robusta TaxID=1487602 RepID=A0A7S4HMF3_9EUKA|mmetsp:Transcript_12880/g.16085  ORF Transcript_12880/g.16085 Transcript_12880/m.16085 type:complete len:379 (+) Transcript_12880:66-1202(+)